MVMDWEDYVAVKIPAYAGEGQQKYKISSLENGKFKVYSKFIKKKIKSLDERKRKDIDYFEMLMQFQYYALTGDDSRTWRGIHITYFGHRHFIEDIKAHMEELCIIIDDVRGEGYAEKCINEIKKKYRAEKEEERKQEREWLESDREYYKGFKTSWDEYHRN